MESYRDQISQSDPEIKGVLYYFEGWAYANRKEYGKALNALDKALNVLPGYRQALNLKHDIQAVFQ
jgi:tetratricopeptide (TPR) repeat protein